MTMSPTCRIRCQGRFRTRKVWQPLTDSRSCDSPKFPEDPAGTVYTDVLRTRRYKATNTDVRIIDSLFLLAKALLRYVSQLFEVSGSTLAYPRFRPPRVGTDVSRRYLEIIGECIIFIFCFKIKIVSPIIFIHLPITFNTHIYNK